MTFNKSLLIPLGVFVLLVVFLALGFRLQNPHLLPSALIDKPFPEFELKDLHQPEMSRTLADLSGEVSLVNVWATWCPNCLIEHPELLRISRETDLPLYGVNYNDDNEKALGWLTRLEDPYVFSIIDDKGTLAIDLGVYGAPETFVLDARGVIRFRHVGPVTPEVWQETLLPVVELLKGMSGG
jgi:cytochrome c biogenesis protein CcmG, thiol:disulfide interchange protein DsbE